MANFTINGQAYDLIKQQYIPSTNGHNGPNGHHNGASCDDCVAVLELPEHQVEVASPQAVIEGAVRQILAAIGEDPDRQGLARTPTRVAKAYAELTSGYHVDPEALLNGAVFDVDYDEMVVVKDIDFYSLCEHHLLPFYGKAHVAYVPNGKVIGLSKIPRIVEMFARRLQVQERMTQQIADFLLHTLDAQGVGVVVEGQHMCAAMRGVKKANARMTTSAMLGSFKHNPQTRAEFMAHIGRSAYR